MTMQRSGSLRYFVLTLGWTFLFWGIAAVAGLSSMGVPGLLLLFLGGLGPALTAILLIWREGDAARRDFWRRIVDFRRIGSTWYAVIFLTVPLIGLLAIGTQYLLTGQGYDFGAPLALLARPLSLLPLIGITFFFGPLPEELGWRGYVLDRLQARWNGLTASLILAAVWAVWHVPLFFIPDTYQQALGFGTAAFWLFMAEIFPYTLLMTWIYNHTGRSTLSAILFHFMINFSGQFLDPGQGFAAHRLAWAMLFALVVVTLSGRNLGKHGNEL
jgi:membrane protease YdiL (CAAX protease family)